MRVDCLRRNPAQYSCNAYLIRGDWNRLEDVNTLIDVGSDGYVMQELKQMATGVGKRPVEQIVLTHNHFDHASGASELKRCYNCNVLAAAPQIAVNLLVRDGQRICCGDRELEVLLTPGHSNDSLCLYGAVEKVLFSGDTTLNIRLPGGCYSREYLLTLQRLAELDIQIVYPGHGNALRGDIHAQIVHTLRCVRQSEIVDSN